MSANVAEVCIGCCIGDNWSHVQSISINFNHLNLSCLLFFPFEDSKSFGQSEASAIDLDFGIACLKLLGYALQLLLGLCLDEFLRISERPPLESLLESPLDEQAGGLATVNFNNNNNNNNNHHHHHNHNHNHHNQNRNQELNKLLAHYPWGKALQTKRALDHWAGSLHHLSILLEGFHDIHTWLFSEDQDFSFERLLQGLLPCVVATKI